MNTAQLVRLCLQHHRSQGLPFREAWTRALQSIPRGTVNDVKADRKEWVVALRWARPEFEAAYYLRERGEPLTDPALQAPDEAEPVELALTG